MWTAPQTGHSIGTLLVLGVNNFTDEEIYLESACGYYHPITQRGGKFPRCNLGRHYPVAVGQFPNSPQSKYLQPHAPIVFPRDYLNNLNDFQLLNTIPKVYEYRQLLSARDYLGRIRGANYLIALTNLNPQLPVQAPTENSFIRPWNDPQRSYEMQDNILETLCAPPQHILNYDNFLLGFTIIPSLLKTTLSNELIVESCFKKDQLGHPPPNGQLQHLPESE